MTDSLSISYFCLIVRSTVIRSQHIKDRENNARLFLSAISYKEILFLQLLRNTTQVSLILWYTSAVSFIKIFIEYFLLSISTISSTSRQKFFQNKCCFISNLVCSFGIVGKRFALRLLGLIVVYLFPTKR